MSTKRFGIEALIVVILLLALVGVWWYGGHRAAAERAELEAACATHMQSLEAQTAQWTRALAASQAEAVFRAFASGIHPLVLPERRDSLDQAIAALLELDGIDSVHVLSATGDVLASSDRKLQTTGHVDERGSWALEATGLVRRPSELPGITELAAPIVGPSGPAGYLWMGYKTDAVRDAARP